MDEEHFWATLVYVEQIGLRAGLADDCARLALVERSRPSRRRRGLLDLVRRREQHKPESRKRCVALGLRDFALLERMREATLYGKPVGRRRVPRPH